MSEKIETYLKNTLSKVLKLDNSKIASSAPLTYLGMDSIMIGTLTKELKKNVGVISPTVFFEHQSIDELVGYFLENHTSRS